MCIRLCVVGYVWSVVCSQLFVVGCVSSLVCSRLCPSECVSPIVSSRVCEKRGEEERRGKREGDGLADEHENPPTRLSLE